MRKILIIMLAITFIGCNKENIGSDCYRAIKDPLNELEWLKELKNTMNNCTCEKSIIEAKYKNQIVYYIAITDPLCNSVFSRALFDCNGTIVKTYGYNDQDIFYNEVERLRRLYTCTEE